MQNEFEKQVQQKMEELNLVPSAPVWVKVEKQIRKKRQKRRFFFFLLQVVLLVAIGIWWMASGNNYTRSTSQDKTVSSNKTVTSAKNENVKPIDQAQNQSGTLTKVQNQTSKPLETPALINIIEKESEKISSETFSKTNATKTHSNTKNSVVKTSPQKTSIIEKQKNKTEVEATSIPSGHTIEHPDKTRMIVEVERKEKTDVADYTPVIANVEKNETASTDSTSKKDSPKKENAKTEVKISDSSVKKKVAKSDKKWEKVFTFQAGVSSYQKGVFAGQKSMVASPLQNGGFGGGGAGQRFPMYDSAGKNNGFSFAIGSGVKRKLGEKFEFHISLQYRYSSVRGWVGEKKQDTAVLYSGNNLPVPDFYTNGNWNNYTTSYGMIELPVSISYQAFKKIPLQLSAGTAYGRLLHSNELTFDNSKNIYYKNKDNRVKNFFNLFSGLQYRVFEKNKMKITTGPLVQYSISRTQKDNQYTRPHLFFAGIKTDINF